MSTAIYDESHDYGHAIAVRDMSRIIAADLAGGEPGEPQQPGVTPGGMPGSPPSGMPGSPPSGSHQPGGMSPCEPHPLEVDSTILETVAMVHDVCDHKYINKGSIPESELEKFLVEYLKDHPDPNVVSRVLDIVYCVSWSKQVKGISAERVAALSTQDKLHLDIVRDADRIMAIGVENGVRRCRAYAFAMQESPTEESAISHVIEHCKEKLLRLYPERFIVTKKGREIAKPLHDEMQEWWNKAHKNEEFPCE